MLAATAEPRPMAKMGRPPRPDNPEMKMVRITKDANEGARTVCGFFGESISAYIDRVVKERVEADKILMAKQFSEAKPKAKGKEAD